MLALLLLACDASRTGHLPIAGPDEPDTGSFWWADTGAAEEAPADADLEPAPPLGAQPDYEVFMRFLHSMMRVNDPVAAQTFFCDLLGMRVVRRTDHEAGRFSLIFLETGTPGDTAQLELTWNWDQTEPYSRGRNFGHLAFAVPDLYATCARLASAGVALLRPPRDGRMAFIASPDGISVELLQEGAPLPPAEPWLSMPNHGTW